MGAVFVVMESVEQPHTHTSFASMIANNKKLHTTQLTEVCCGFFLFVFLSPRSLARSLALTVRFSRWSRRRDGARLCRCGQATRCSMRCSSSASESRPRPPCEPVVNHFFLLLLLFLRRQVRNPPLACHLGRARRRRGQHCHPVLHRPDDCGQCQRPVGHRGPGNLGD